MRVRHRLGSYPIEFGDLDAALASLPEDMVVITDRNVEDLYRRRLPQEARVIAVHPGEPSKSVAAWEDLLRTLSQRGASRATSVVAFGGGVVGDLAGFVAASYMRGVDLIQIPTTLLAQIDSSVGGKVGIDLPEGKNLVGAFYPPQVVHICVETLETLPPRDLCNGLAEAWKAGFILDAALVKRLRDRRPGSVPDADLIRRCIELKKEVVEADEMETSGERAKLNFGHTVGHALEKLGGYTELLHGEAISIGMVAEAALGESIGLTAGGTRAVVEESLRSEGLPISSVLLKDVDRLVASMRGDKKAVKGRLAFSLLTGIGSCRLVDNVPEGEVRAALANL